MIGPPQNYSSNPPSSELPGSTKTQALLTEKQSKHDYINHLLIVFLGPNG